MNVPLELFASPAFFAAWLALSRASTVARVERARCDVPVLPSELKRNILYLAFETKGSLVSNLRDFVINTDEEEDCTKIELEKEYFIVKPGNSDLYTRVAGVKSRIVHGFAGWCFIEVINDSPFVGRLVPVRLLLDASYVHPEDEVSFSQALNAEHWRSQNRGICYKTFDTFRKFTVFIVVSKYLGYDYKHYVGDAPHLTPPQKKYLLGV